MQICINIEMNSSSVIREVFTAVKIQVVVGYQGEDGGSVALRNVAILQHHFTVT
jgi:hypothetical protein